MGDSAHHEGRTWKHRLSERFPYSGLLQLLIFNFWFRLVFLLMVVFVVFMALFLPKIWRVSPEGFNPVVKVSGLDLAQAWSLRRTAERAAVAGDEEEALFAWRAAVANNLANAGNLRGFLGYLAERGDRRDTLYMAYAHSGWLLRLTATNRADVRLVARVYDSYHLPQLVVNLLEPYAEDLSESEAVAYLKALFETGRMDTFRAVWEGSGMAVREDPEVELYRLAYLAGWGDPGEAPAAREALRERREDSEYRGLVGRLRLTVAHQRRDLTAYGEILEGMKEAGLDQPTQHLLYWKLLKEEGHEAEAVRLARDYPFPPASAQNLLQFADIYIELGLKEEAMDILARNLPQYGASESVWFKQASLLGEEGRWRDLKELAVQMRVDERVPSELEGFSYYLQGRAEYEMQRLEAAEEAFRVIPAYGIKQPSLALHVAANLTRLQYPGIAMEILQPLEEEMGDSLAYWQATYVAAVQMRDMSLSTRAAETLYRLRPDNWVIRFNYAAALISRRENAAEAVTLTMGLLREKPGFLGIRINHALALLMNFRVDEAADILESIPAGELNPEYAASFYLAWFECYLQQEKWDRAKEVLPRIERRYLFPAEVDWLDRQAARLPEEEISLPGSRDSAPDPA